MLFCIRKSKLGTYIPIIRQEMERPIDFRSCCIQRRPIVIPCEVEIGNNYQDFKKYKFAPEEVNAQVQLLDMPPMSIQERFTAPPIKFTNEPESKLTELIYREQMRKVE